MSRVIWKPGHIISIETRTGVFAIAQMSRSPYLVFFDLFRPSHDWTGVDLRHTPRLFCCAVTSPFLKHSNIHRQLKVTPADIKALPKRWIHPGMDSRQVRAWAGTPHERVFVTIGQGGSLVERDILGHRGGPYAHPSGVFDRIVIKSIDPSDAKTIDKHDLDGLAVFPATNERLYLCHLLGRSVDPEKDILFDRKLPLEYATYVDIIRGGGTKRNQAKLRKLYAFSKK